MRIRDSWISQEEYENSPFDNNKWRFVDPSSEQFKEDTGVEWDELREDLEGLGNARGEVTIVAGFAGVDYDNLGTSEFQTVEDTQRDVLIEETFRVLLNPDEMPSGNIQSTGGVARKNLTRAVLPHKDKWDILGPTEIVQRHTETDYATGRIMYEVLSHSFHRADGGFRISFEGESSEVYGIRQSFASNPPSVNPRCVSEVLEDHWVDEDLLQSRLESVAGKLDIDYDELSRGFEAKHWGEAVLRAQSLYEEVKQTQTDQGSQQDIMEDIGDLEVCYQVIEHANRSDVSEEAGEYFQRRNDDYWLSRLKDDVYNQARHLTRYLEDEGVEVESSVFEF